MVFGPNTSPLAGREGSQLTGTKIGERLQVGAQLAGGAEAGARDHYNPHQCDTSMTPRTRAPPAPKHRQAEAETNVSLRVMPVEGSGGESFEVQARGELQLGLLIGGCVGSSRLLYSLVGSLLRFFTSRAYVWLWQGLGMRRAAAWPTCACMRCCLWMCGSSSH